MEHQSLSRWQQFYLDDAKLGTIPMSACVDQAARIFARNKSQIILDLGCTGRTDYKVWFGHFMKK